MTSKSEQAAELRRKAEELEQEEHLAERMKDADTIPTCPKCGGRTFIVNTYTTVAQSIIYGDEEGEEEWGDDYESGDHTDINESAICSDCRADAQEVLEARGWTFYDEPRPQGQESAMVAMLRIVQSYCRTMTGHRQRRTRAVDERSRSTSEGHNDEGERMSTRPNECGYCGMDHGSGEACPTKLAPMTVAEKYAAIVAMLKDERGDWREDVNGGDLVEQVSLIIDAPEGDPRPPISAAAQAEDHPWCHWTLGFADGSDWDTAAHYGFSPLVTLQFRLTTTDGRSRAVQLVNSQYIDDAYRNEPTGDCERKAGIEVVELDTEDYSPKHPEVRERVPYEDIREVIVF